MTHPRGALAALVFGAGTGSLATEIAASRLLAPYFGSSTIVWANLIGIVLAGLASGYWVGGRIADRRPEPRLLGRPLESVAILGNAGGTTARALGVFYPSAEIDGVELDPAVSRVGRRWFGLGDNPRLTVHDADARPFLRRTDRRYDLIVADAYRQPYVPFYLATREFFRLVQERLTPGGILALNVAAVPGDDSLLDGVTGTLKHEFETVAVWPALRFNKIVLASDSRDGFDIDLLRRGPEPLRSLRELLARDLRLITEQAADPWTDDRAPVEWVTDKMIVEYAARGGELDEDLLPTSP